MKSQGKNKGASNKKFQEQLFEVKKKYDAESKKSREQKKKLDQLEVENKVLRNKLKNLSGKKRGRGDDKRLRQLIRENRALRKRLRAMMKELDKRRRWYRRATKIFKNNQDKWIKAQRNAFKDRKFIVKYVFLDDVKYIKQYQRPRTIKNNGKNIKGRNKTKFRNRIRVKTKGGGEAVVKNVEIVVLDEDEDGEEEEEDDDEKEKEKKKKKKKKKKKNEAEKEEEIEKFLDDFMGEIGMMNDEVVGDEEELKSLPSDFEEDDDEEDEEDEEDEDDKYEDEQDENEENEKMILFLRQEMDERAVNDLEALKALIVSSDKYSNPEQEINKLINETINHRQNEMETNLANLNCDIKPVKESNDEWKKYMLNLSQCIIGNIQQFDQLSNIINNGFLKELNGRTMDLKDVNNVYYDEEQIDFEQIQNKVDQRHDEISNDIQTAKEEILKREENEIKEKEKEDEDTAKINELYQGLIATNNNWNEVISSSSSMYAESTKSKNNLIQQIMSKYAKLQELMMKVEKMPSTVLF